jgi:hypothetical protein
MKTHSTHKKAKLALARETVVELRPQLLAAIHGGAGGRPQTTGDTRVGACCMVTADGCPKGP